VHEVILAESDSPQELLGLLQGHRERDILPVALLHSGAEDLVASFDELDVAEGPIAAVFSSCFGEGQILLAKEPCSSEAICGRAAFFPAFLAFLDFFVAGIISMGFVVDALVRWCGTWKLRFCELGFGEFVGDGGNL
jgi:hypothetical protein